MIKLTNLVKNFKIPIIHYFKIDLNYTFYCQNKGEGTFDKY